MDGQTETHADRRRRLITDELMPSRRMRICDVGANPLGTPVYHGLLVDRVAEVFGFEPAPEPFAKLQDIKSDLETYFQTAIGRPGLRTLYLHRWGGLTSLLKIDPTELKPIGCDHWGDAQNITEETVMCQGLDQVEGLPQVDLLKMDLQGAEIEVLETGPQTLEQALVVIPEVRFTRIYENELLFADMDHEMRARGFRLHKFFPVQSKMFAHSQRKAVNQRRLRTQALDGDAVYLRAADVSDLSDDQVIFLAFAAEAVFDSPDLVLHCLDALVARGLVPEGLPATYVKHLRSNQKAS